VRRFFDTPRPAWALDQSEYVMAKRTKRAPALKTMASKKGAKKTKLSKKQPAKRSLNTKARRRKTSQVRAFAAKPATKRSAPRRRGTSTRRETPQPEMTIGEIAQTETTIVDLIEEPVPGVFVVTEFVERNAVPDPPESLNIDQTTESEER
jgi:hypothetical protein